MVGQLDLLRQAVTFTAGLHGALPVSGGAPLPFPPMRVRSSLTALVLLACARGEHMPSDTTRVELQPPAAVIAARRASLAAMANDSMTRAQQDSILRASPGYVVDSARSPEDDLRRFRSGLPEVRELYGPSSRDELLSAFDRAVTTADDAALGALTISRAEFAWLVYPSSPYTRPPTVQPAGLVWRLIASSGDVGRRRLLERLGTSYAPLAHHCPLAPEVQGDNRIWNGCTVTHRLPDGRTVTQRLHGPIIQRHGHFRFVSLANDF